MKIRINYLLAFLIVTFSLTTLLSTFVQSANKFLGIIIFFSFFYYAIKYVNRKTGLIYCGLLVSVAFSFFMTGDAGQNLNECIYWTLTILAFSVCCDRRFIHQITTGFQHYYKYIKIVIYFCAFTLVVGFFDSSCYSNFWQGGYFVGYAHSAHSLCSGCCIVLALTLLSFKDDGISIQELVLLAIPSVAILRSGARTFLIPLIIVWAILYTNQLKTKSLKIILLPIILILGTYLLSKTNMFRKFLFALRDTNTSSVAIESFTSGRMIFWKIDLDAFFHSNMIEQVFGHGFSYIFDLNLQEYGKYIWGHNDVITILLSCGIVGLVVYISTIYYHYKRITGMLRINKFYMFLYIIFPLLVNGLYEYQHFLFSYIVLCVYFALENEKFPAF